MGWKVQAKRNDRLRSGKFAAARRMPLRRKVDDGPFDVRRSGTWRGVEWEGEAR